MRLVMRSPWMRFGRRAFALPIVMLLATVATIAALVMLERHANTHLAVQRQIDAYYEHHARLGLKEMIDQWLLTTGGNVGERLLDGGLAFELVFSGNRTIRVWMEDGQGSLLRRPAGTGGAIDAARIAAENIALSMGEDPFASPGAGRPTSRPNDRSRDKDDLEELERPKLRDAGPLAVSALSADFDVLVAIAEASGAGEASPMIANEIMNEREDGQLSAGDIAKACDTAGVEPAVRAIIGRILTTTPTVWRVVAESDEGRWMGLLEQAPRAGGLSGSGASTLLEWERVPEDELW